MGYNQRNNPFSRRSSSPLNQNGHDYSDPKMLKPIPKWKTEEEQATMKADDPGGYYTWLTDMKSQEEARIKDFEKKIGDYALSTAENVEGGKLMSNKEIADREIERQEEGYVRPLSPGDAASAQTLGNIIANQNGWYEGKEGFDHAAVLREGFPGVWNQLGGNRPGRGEYACNSYTCSIASQAGATMPRDINRDGVVDDKDVYKIWEGGKEYRGGEAWPVIPGTAQFNTDREALGLTLLDASTKPDPNKPQFIRKSSHGRVFPADGHSILSTGLQSPERPEHGVTIEGAGLRTGPGLDDYYSNPSIFMDADGDGEADLIDAYYDSEGNAIPGTGSSYRIMDYEGDLPYFNTKLEGMSEWKAEQDKIKAEEKAANEAARKANIKQIMSLGL